MRKLVVVLLVALTFASLQVVAKDRSPEEIIGKDFPIKLFCVDIDAAVDKSILLGPLFSMKTGMKANKILKMICASTHARDLLMVENRNPKGLGYWVFSLRNKSGCDFQFLLEEKTKGEYSGGHNEQSTCTKKPDPVVQKRSLPFSTGDRVYVSYQNGKKCKATVLIPGKEQSKIEYNESCDVNFMTGKSGGEKEWAPNHSLTSR